MSWRSPNQRRSHGSPGSAPTDSDLRAHGHGSGTERRAPNSINSAAHGRENAVRMEGETDTLDGTNTDIDDDLTEVSDDEFPGHFIQRQGRLFHSHGNLPYPLPIDTPEQERQLAQHECLKALIGANYIGPVLDVLSPDPSGRTKRVLDLGCGTGRWIMEMAYDFPHVKFYGLDIAPIGPREQTLPNVMFIIGDFTRRLWCEDGSIDLVHARSISSSVRNYPALLPELGRVLRSGGLFLSGEYGRHPAFHNDYIPTPFPRAPSPEPWIHPLSWATFAYFPERAPGMHRFFAHLNEALHRTKGIIPVAYHVEAYLNNTQAFTPATAKTFQMPIGTWQRGVPEWVTRLRADGRNAMIPTLSDIGGRFRAAHSRYADAMRVLLCQSGLTEQQVEQLISDYKRDLRHVEGMVSFYDMVYAFRR